MASSDKSEEFKKRQLIGQAIMAGLLTPQAVGLPGLDDIVLAGTSGAVTTIRVPETTTNRPAELIRKVVAIIPNLSLPHYRRRVLRLTLCADIVMFQLPSFDSVSA